MGHGGKTEGTLAVCLFGPVRAELDGTRCALGGPKPRGLLALLALAGSKDVHADTLVAGLWEGEDGDPSRSLRVLVSRLRSSLDGGTGDGRGVVEGRYPLYRLAHSVRVDAISARHLVAEASALAHSDPDAGLELLTEAARLVDGEPLADLLSLPFARTAAPALAELRLSVEDGLTAALLGRFGIEPTLPHLWDRARSAPGREPRWQRLAESLVALGRTTEALLALDEGERVIASTGLAPGLSSRLQALRSTLRAGSPVGRPAPPGDVPPALASREPEVWAGRRRELADLIDLCRAHLLDPRGRVVEVIGTGGVGKTSLAAVFARSAAGLGYRIVYLRWRRQVGGSLVPLVEAGLIPPSGGSDAPVRSVDAVERAHRAIGRLSALDPVVLILDDVHWASGTAREAIAELLAAEDLGVLALVLRRPEPQPELVSGREPDLTIRLRPLDASERSEMEDRLRRLGHGVGPDGPHAVPWVVDALARGTGRPRLTTWWDDADAIDRRVLESLALSPEELPVGVLVAAVETSPDIVLGRARAIVADGLATESWGAVPAFRPVHDLVAELVIELMGPGAVAAGHARLHRAHLRTGGGPLIRAHHLLASEVTTADEVTETVTEAVDLLLASGLHRDVVELLDIAGRWAGEELSTRLAAARTYAAACSGDDVDSSGRLLELADVAASVEDWAGVVAALSYRNLLGHELGSEGRELSVIERARAASAGATTRRDLDLLHLEFTARLHDGASVEELAPIQEAASQRADSLGAPGPRGRVSHLFHQVQTMRGARPAATTATSRRTLRLALEAGDRTLEAIAHADLFFDRINDHDLGGAQTAVEALTELDDPHGRWYGLQGRAALALDHDDVSGAWARCEEARQFGQRHGIPSTVDGHVGLSFVIAWVSGEVGDLAAAMAEVAWRTPSGATFAAATSVALVQAGDLDAARRRAVEVGRHLADNALAGWQEPATYALLAEAAAATGSLPLAARCASALDRWAGGRVFLAADLGPVDRYRALCAMTVGDLDRAARLFAAAAHQAGGPLWEARVALDRARLDGRPEGREPGQTWAWMPASEVRPA